MKVKTLLLLLLLLALGLPAAAATTAADDGVPRGSENAKEVLRLFNTNAMLRQVFADGIRETESRDPEEAAFMRQVFGMHDDDAALDLFGAELDKLVSADDLAEFVAFLQTDAGLAMKAALHDAAPTPDAMQAALADLPPDVRKAADAWATNGVFERVAGAVNAPEFQASGARYGASLVCRAAAKYRPERLSLLRDTGVCDGEVPAAKSARGVKGD